MMMVLLLEEEDEDHGLLELWVVDLVVEMTCVSCKTLAAQP